MAPSHSSGKELTMAEYVFNLWESEAPYVEGGEADYDVVMAAHEAFSKAVVEAGGTVVQGWALRGIKSATFLRGTRTDAVHTEIGRAHV